MYSGRRGRDISSCGKWMVQVPKSSPTRVIARHGPKSGENLEDSLKLVQDPSPLGVIYPSTIIGLRHSVLD